MPTWNMVGKPIATADMTTVPVVTQKFKIPTTLPHSLLQGAVLGLIFHDSIFTNISLELWANRAGAPSKLIASSLTSWTKLQVDAAYPLDYKFLWVGFQFTPVPLRKGVDYHLALRATGYTGDDTNHIAWRHAYPDAQYQAGLGFTIETKKAAVTPLEALIFAAEM